MTVGSFYLEIDNFTMLRGEEEHAISKIDSFTKLKRGKVTNLVKIETFILELKAFGELLLTPMDKEPQNW